MGRSHGNEKTFALQAEHLSFVEKKDLFNVVKSILSVYRDYGRTDDRKMFRLKYVVLEKGTDWIRE